MLIDCDTCSARPRACGDCVVTVLLGQPSSPRGLGDVLDAEDRAAVDVLARAGMVPPLRLQPAPRFLPDPRSHPGGTRLEPGRGRRAG